MRLIFFAVTAAGLLAAQTPVDRAWSVLGSGLVDKSAGTRAKALRALGLAANDAKAREAAEKALSDPNAEVQAAAAVALGQMGAKTSADKLVELIGSKETVVVFASASALFALNDPRAYDVYYAVLTGQKKSGQSLIDSQLKMIRDPEAMLQMGFETGLGFIPFAGIGYSFVKSATKDDSSPVRAAAAEKLVRDADTKTAAALVQALSDKKWLVRAAAADAIAKRNDTKSARSLAPLLNDSNDTVKFTAAAALLRLNAKPAASN